MPAPADELAAIDLEPLLYEPGDLPEAYSKWQVSSGINRLFRDAPQPAGTLNIALKRNDVQAAVTSVLLYPDVEQRDAAYELAVSRRTEATHAIGPAGRMDFPTPEARGSDLGERSAIFLGSGFGTGEQAEVAFTRCGAVVWVHVYGGQQGERIGDLATRYARRLDSRLAPVVCE